MMAALLVGCAETSDSFGTPAGMRARINELCEDASADIDAGNVNAIRSLADRIESEVSETYEDAVATVEELRAYAVQLEDGNSPERPQCHLVVLPLTGGD